MRYAISCEPWQEKGFRIRTNQKVVTLSADSVPSRDEWVKAIRKVIFKAQNAGESVKVCILHFQVALISLNAVQIAIPYSVVVDIEKSSAMDFSETIEVKVIEQEDKTSNGSSDSYFFAYFHNISGALEQIRDAVRTYKPQVQSTLGVLDAVHDTTGVKVATTPNVTASPLNHTVSLPVENQTSKGSYGLRLPLPSIPFLRPFQSDSGSQTPPAQNMPAKSGFPTESVVPSTSASSTKTIRPARSDVTVTKGTVENVLTQRTMSDTAASPPNRLSDYMHTYPPPPSPESELVSVPTSSNSSSSWTGWLKGPRRVFNSPSASSSGATIGRKGSISEVVTNSHSHVHGAESFSSDFGFSVLEARDAAEPEVIEKFRTTFAFDEREQLLGCEPPTSCYQYWY